MATVITKSIGTNVARDYADLTQFEAALPPDLVAVDQQWTGQLYNDGEIVENVGATVVFGSTTDATRFVRLEAAPGQSFMDHDFSTDALAYNPAFGVAVRSSHGVTFGSTLQLGAACDFIEINGIQFKATDTKSRAIRLHSGAGHLLTNCILATTGARGHSELGAGVTRNCLLIQEGSAVSADGPDMGTNGKLVNCTVVAPSDLAQTRRGINGTGSTGQLENCAIFGFPTAMSVNLTGDYNASDETTTPGVNSKDSLVYASQFVSATLAGQDWKVKDASAGIADGGASADVDVTGFDILGAARDATPANRSIGAWELVAGGGQVTKTATVPTAAMAQLQAPHIASLAWSSELLVLEPGAVEILSGLDAGSPATVAVLGDIAAAAGLTLALEGGVALTRSVDTAFTGVLIAAGIIPAGVRVERARSFAIEVEALGGFLAAAGVPLEISATIVTAAPIPLEFTAGAIVDRQLAASWLAAMAAPHALPGGWSTIVVIERDVPADWAGSQIFVAGNVRVFSRDARGRVFTSAARAVVFPTAPRRTRFHPVN